MGKDEELLPCPWCGTAPVMQKWHGGGPQKRLIGCNDLYCAANPSVTGPSKKKAMAAWNSRTPALERSHDAG